MNMVNALSGEEAIVQIKLQQKYICLEITLQIPKS